MPPSAVPIRTSPMTIQQSSNHPPPQPVYILRGHSAVIHSVCFLRQNSRLLTGDADGWVVLWNLAIKRAVGVWKAHQGPILGLKAWGVDRIITHGRDEKLNVWQLNASSEASLSTTLPVDDPSAHRTPPWLLHSLSVNTLNFCSFAMCPEQPPSQASAASNGKDTVDAIYIAVPGTKDDHADIHQLPRETRLWSVTPPPQKVTSPLKKASPGMVMALTLHRTPSHLLLAAGYEAGTTHLFSLALPHPPTLQAPWQLLHTSTPHTQPILSLTLAPSLSCYFTSGADALLARHPFPLPLPSSSTTPASNPAPAAPSEKVVNTRHSGQQSLTLRSDGKLLATAGWDGRVRVYGAREMGELAVLKWHREACYCVAFAEVAGAGGGDDGGPAVGVGKGREGRGLLRGGDEGSAGVEGQDEEDEDRLGGQGNVGRGDAEGRALSGPARTGTMVENVRERREREARETHWLAAGSKDGKVSLWKIF